MLGHPSQVFRLVVNFSRPIPFPPPIKAETEVNGRRGIPPNGELSASLSDLYGHLGNSRSAKCRGIIFLLRLFNVNFLLYSVYWHPDLCSGLKLFLGSKVLCVFCNLCSLPLLHLSPQECRFQNQTCTEPLTPEITPPLYTRVYHDPSSKIRVSLYSSNV